MVNEPLSFIGQYWGNIKKDIQNDMDFILGDWIYVLLIILSILLLLRTMTSFLSKSFGAWMNIFNFFTSLWDLWLSFVTTFIITIFIFVGLVAGLNFAPGVKYWLYSNVFTSNTSRYMLKFTFDFVTDVSYFLMNEVQKLYSGYNRDDTSNRV